MTTPTSDIDESAQRISGKAELVDFLEAGCKPAADWRVGTEHEKFGFIRDGLRPLPYDGEASVRTVLERLSTEYGWEPIREGEHMPFKASACPIRALDYDESQMRDDDVIRHQQRSEVEYDC